MKPKRLVRYRALIGLGLGVLLAGCTASPETWDVIEVMRDIYRGNGDGLMADVIEAKVGDRTACELLVSQRMQARYNYENERDNERYRSIFKCVRSGTVQRGQVVTLTKDGLVEVVKEKENK